MQPQQESFDTLGRAQVTGLIRNMAPYPKVPAPSIYSFLSDLYADMLENPDAYAIPVEQFQTFFTRSVMTDAEKAQHEALKEARLRVRKTVLAYPEWLYALGLAAEADAGGLRLSRAAFNNLAASCVKKAKIPTARFLAAWQRSGLAFSDGDPLQVTCPAYPDLPAVLVSFSLACSRVKDFDFYIFQRGDLGVFEHKAGPEFSDVLRLVPEPFCASVSKTDALLQQLRFKREIFFDNGICYRVRYNKKGGEIVYWLRIMEPFHHDLGHFLRWKLDSPVTPRLFTRLDDCAPGLADRIFMGLKTCEHCYGDNCMARAHVERGGVRREVCGECWDQIGWEEAQCADMWTVIKELDHVVSAKAQS